MIARAAGIQNGDSIHHQSQLITPQSFNTMKAISKRVSPEIPPVFV